MPVSVLHVCDKFGVRGSSIHGVSRLFSWWFPRYDSSRFQVSLCGLKPAEPASQLLTEQGIQVTHLDFGKFDPRILPNLVRLARRHQARILHVHGYAASNFGRLAARHVGVALILHEHFADPHMPAYQSLADRLLAPITHRAIAVSRSTQAFLVRERHIPESRVRLIWNGAPLSEFAPPSPDRVTAIRQTLGLSKNIPVIGTIGRLNEQKGHRYLLEAAAQVLAADKSVRFLIVGDGDLEGILQQQAKQLGIADAVIFAGHQTDIPGILGVLNILCIPSVYEGTPLVLFEAMAAGKAIVSTAVDGCREVLEDGETALLVPPQDSKALAQALLRVLRDRELQRTLSRKAYTASSQYDVNMCVEKMQNLYDEVLREQSK